MTLHVAIPLLRELENLEALLNDIDNQSISDFKVYFCVNNPEAWHDLPEKQNDILDNQKTLEVLKTYELKSQNRFDETQNLNLVPYKHGGTEDTEDTEKHGDKPETQNSEPGTQNHKLTVIDCSSKGNGFDLKSAGVGLARKILMDRISELASEDDIIISLDADTRFGSKYFESIKNNFQHNKRSHAISVPYYHPLTESKEQNYCILRYEIYMRHYMINMLKIGNPYAFTALGSAIALPVWAYRKVGGISPRKSGEDFYLLQSLRKSGEITLWNEEHVYPQSRFSDRVAFGTGPAMIKGMAGDWNSYPFYNKKIFKEVEETYSLFEELFEKDIETPMSEFLCTIFKTNDLWSLLRKNYKSLERFTHACMVKVDALRILQYLRFRQQNMEQEEYEITQEIRDRMYLEENELRV